jgi:hypothetical protein
MPHRPSQVTAMNGVPWQADSVIDEPRQHRVGRIIGAKATTPGARWRDRAARALRAAPGI